MADLRGTTNDMMSQMQADLVTWQQRWQEMLQSLRERAEGFQSEGSESLASWQGRWQQLIGEFQQQAREYENEALTSAKQFTDSLTGTAKPLADALVSFAETAFSAQEQFLSGLLPKRPAADAPSAPPSPKAGRAKPGADA